MRHRLRTAALLGALLVIALAAACNNDDGGGQEDETPDAQTSPTTEGTPATSGEVLTPEEILRKDPNVTKRDEIDWGWMFEQSGPLSGFGVPAGDGVLMAVQEINDAGGFQVGDTIYTINLIKHDTQSDVTQTIGIATELIQDNNVKVIWGPASVGDPGSTQITQQAGVLHICPCPQREVTSLTSAEQVRDESPYAFQTLAAPSAFLPPGARNTREQYPQFDTFATICADSETGRAFCDFFEEAYSDAGFQHVDRQLFPSETVDFSPFLTSMRNSDPDIVLNFVDAGPEQFTLIRQSWQLDVGEYYIGVELPYNIWEPLVGGPDIRNKIVSVGAAPRGHAQYTSAKAEEFFEEKYKGYLGGDLRPAAFAALLTYDPAYMLVAAMQRAGTVDDVDAIAQALEEVHFAGYGEDDMSFNNRHIIVTGNDSCLVTQGQMTCQHNPPPAPEDE